jgi:hypothetical protein
MASSTIKEITRGTKLSPAVAAALSKLDVLMRSEFQPPGILTDLFRRPTANLTGRKLIHGSIGLEPLM